MTLSQHRDQAQHQIRRLLPLALSLERLRDTGLRQTAHSSLAWRLRLEGDGPKLLNSQEAGVLDDLAADLEQAAGGRPTSRLVAVRQELSGPTALRRWMAPRNVSFAALPKPRAGPADRRALGCVLIIGAWNYSVLALDLGSPWLSALAAGNTAVLKALDTARDLGPASPSGPRRHLDPVPWQVGGRRRRHARQLLEDGTLTHLLYHRGGRVGRLGWAAPPASIFTRSRWTGWGKRARRWCSADADLAVRRRCALREGASIAGQRASSPDHLLRERKPGLRPALISALEAEFMRGYGPGSAASPRSGPRIVNRASSSGSRPCWGGQATGFRSMAARPERSREHCASPPPCWPSIRPTTR